MNKKQKISISLLFIFLFIIGFLIICHARGFNAFILGLSLLLPGICTILYNVFIKNKEINDEYYDDDDDEF